MAKQIHTFAAIHVGSEQVSIQIAEFNSLQDIRIIERASLPVSLGEETFKTGRISFSAVSQTCELLKGYRRMLSEYGVRDYRLVATTAVREAENQQYIIDQIRVKTGFQVEVADMTQEIFFKYIALFRIIDMNGLNNSHEPLLFVDISSGGLGFTLYKEPNIEYQQNIHIGTLRIKESFDKQQRESAHFHKVLSEYIYSTIEPVEQKLRPHKIRYLVLSGSETRFVLKMLGRDQAETLSFVSLDDFNALYEKVQELNLPQLMQTFDLTEQKAEMVLPTIVLYKQILNVGKIEEIVFSNAHFNDGIILRHVAEKTGDSWWDAVEDQTVSLAHSLGKKYQYDSNHAISVEKTSLQIFEKLSKAYGLGKQERLQLKVAAILHDIGKYVSLRRHYFYSYRLIVSSDILGFSEAEKLVIANIAHYHSKGTPSNVDAHFAALTPEQKVTTAKLSAIIRLADAVDRSHRQKAVVKEISLKGDEMTLKVESVDDISLEEWTFADKVEFFENVFGIRAILERRSP
ncbi:phosphatase [Anaerosporomusa subterranea]|uniref:Phosphatase n=1 Tax=Anaerosporomusa subterranea TaxID=1794912 RepID=A0A154BWF8_ANASB|nr:HD domain-containing protein [Anaerosporomusa subterranea]KYZ77798.1 phosphatase [Anaerosporomusa subterranea]